MVKLYTSIGRTTCPSRDDVPSKMSTGGWPCIEARVCLLTGEPRYVLIQITVYSLLPTVCGLFHVDELLLKK